MHLQITQVHPQQVQRLHLTKVISDPPILKALYWRVFLTGIKTSKGLFYANKRIRAMEIIPTTTIHIRFFVKMAVIMVGNEASRFSILIPGKLFSLVINKL